MTILEKAIEAARAQATTNYRNHKGLLNDWRILQESSQYWPDTDILLEIPGANWFLGANTYGGVNIYIELPWNKQIADNVMLAFINLGWELSMETSHEKPSELLLYFLHQYQ